MADVPDGASQDRSSRPRPDVCRSVTSTTPDGQPALARATPTVFVEAISEKTVTLRQEPPPLRIDFTTAAVPRSTGHWST